MEGVPREELVTQFGAVFEPAYVALRAFIRVGGLESDLRLLAPGEFHANTSELIQMLRKGHHGVELNRESWERLSTWIDLNGPCHGNWQDVVGEAKIAGDRVRRTELFRAHTLMDQDYETQPVVERTPPNPVSPVPSVAQDKASPILPEWPWSTQEAQRRQSEGAASPIRRSLDLGAGVSMDLIRIPAGEFIMGDKDGNADEQPPTVVRLEQPFWMGRVEVSNEQFGRFDPTHDSRFEHMTSWIFSEEGLGWPLNEIRQPVVRVNWTQAMAFCRWLSHETGERITLPTEAQWEFACRAGSDRPFSFGGLDDDFSRFANMADVNIRRLVYDARDQYSPDLTPRDARFDDGRLVTANVGDYQSNAWGLHDMHGNAWEWTRSLYRPYPYQDGDGRNEIDMMGQRVVRGGSWYDRPLRCRSAFRLSYPAWQKIYNVSFRVVMEERVTQTVAR
jgi:formylglycine-generating enzyme required for sulfatase activity